MKNGKKKDAETAAPRISNLSGLLREVVAYKRVLFVGLKREDS